MMISKILQEEFSLQDSQVNQIIELIDSGNTVPFIARYRKEQTGNLDDQVLRRLSERLAQLRALQERKEEVMRLIDVQGLLTEELKKAIFQATTQTEVDDLYRPFRPKRRTRATIARERGLQPLADLLLAQNATENELNQLADQLTVEKDGLTRADAYSGAMDILAEQVSEDAWLRRRLRQLLMTEGLVVTKGKTEEITVYESYYDFQEPVRRMAGHRVLAINRGEREKILSVQIALPLDKPISLIQNRLVKKPSASSFWLEQVAEDAWKRLLQPSLETEIRRELTEQAEEQAIDVFAANLRSLLMQPPVRGHFILGIDPGYRTGCKMAVVDPTGRVLDTGVIYPTPPHNQTVEAEQIVLRLVQRYSVDLLSIGNGTASRETELFVRNFVKKYRLNVRWYVVSEAGASVYSASELGAQELPGFDVSLRSAVSIARRLQDPLAELVKIEPKSIGVGQYQHDINSKRLDEALRSVVEDCVNLVGVDLNTASPALLSYVSGLGPVVAQNIVAFREERGPFVSRQALLQVPRLGPMTFQQCAGFLRIPESEEWLDRTFVHPEQYKKVKQLGEIIGLSPSPELAEQARKRNQEELAGMLDLGMWTLADILDAMEKPGRDPRDDIPQPTLRQDILEIGDLKPGMTLQGIVRNVANFGAFVDIGIHQDGLVHLSELSDRYVKDPMSVVRIGQAVQVRVLQVDVKRKRISLSMRGLNQP
ncbi:MAG: RNA-binding transcriptional accessory protein [Clostridia bacterium]|nr:RNA-binding transcriptional accessory protein [Clostridia bacterium]